MKVMNSYEKGELKGQKLNTKQLLSKPEFKQHFLQPLHHLPLDYQLEMLDAVSSKAISLQEMKVCAGKFRSLEVVKRAFVRITNSKNWEEACARFPQFVTTQKLEQFLSLDFKKSVPEVFRIFCNAALSHKNPVAGIGAGNSQAFICHEFSSVTTQDIQGVFPKFSGANLIISSVPNVSK